MVIHLGVAPDWVLPSCLEAHGDSWLVELAHRPPSGSGFMTTLALRRSPLGVHCLGTLADESLTLFPEAEARSGLSNPCGRGGGEWRGSPVLGWKFVCPCAVRPVQLAGERM